KYEEQKNAMFFKSCATIEVSDGMYVLRAKVDPKLTEHIAMGRIFAGQKLRVCGARLQGLSEPCPPLEITSGVFLALSINGVRRGAWGEKLGARRRLPFPIGIKTIQPDGGTVPCVQVVVCRLFPRLYMGEDPETGRWVTHNEQAEQNQQSEIRE